MVAVNAIFFDQFYNFLILSDVIILLLSCLSPDNFPVITRNTSFVIPTLMVTLSFTAEGRLSQILILLGIGFGVLMVHVHNTYKALSCV